MYVGECSLSHFSVTPPPPLTLSPPPCLSVLFSPQPMYYALGHFSCFIPPGSVRIASRVDEPLFESDLEAVAFVTESESRNVTTLVVLNK